MKTNIVYVRFPNGSQYPYLNDKFDLAVGDKVYVDGKLAGKLGEVTEVLTQFKVSLKYYKYVLQKVDYHLKGVFRCSGNFMVATGNDVLPFEQLFSWIRGPEAIDEESIEEDFVCGEGYALDLTWFCDDEAEENTVDGVGSWDGQYLADNGFLKFVTIIDGKGRAVVQTERNLKTVEFDFDAAEMRMSNIFCDCISPRFCDDIAAVAYALEEAFTCLTMEDGCNIMLIEQKLFTRVTEGKTTTVLV